MVRFMQGLMRMRVVELEEGDDDETLLVTATADAVRL